MTTVNPTYLVPVDGSEASLRAVEHAAKQAAHRSPDGRLLIMTVLDLSRVDVFDGFYLTDDQLARVKRDVQTGTLEKAAAAAKAIAPDIEIETKLVDGRTVEAILGEVKSHVHGIIVGRSGKRGPDRLIMGSIPPRLIQNATVPVTVVP